MARKATTVPATPVAVMEAADIADPAEEDAARIGQEEDCNPTCSNSGDGDGSSGSNGKGSRQ